MSPELYRHQRDKQLPPMTNAFDPYVHVFGVMCIFSEAQKLCAGVSGQVQREEDALRHPTQAPPQRTQKGASAHIDCFKCPLQHHFMNINMR